MSNPFDVVRMFEAELCAYTGAKYAVATTSCTMALLIALKWECETDGPEMVEIPRKTYVGVAQSVLNAGHELSFRDENWIGEYQMQPLSLWDSARRMTSGMFRPGHMQCLSFHWTKHLSIGQGGAILHDNDEADELLRRARFDGRREGLAPKDDAFLYPAFHAYMMPRDAAEGLTRLALLPKQNADLPNSDYADLSETFK